MADVNDKVSNLRVVVYKKAEIRNITVKNGDNKGQQLDILTFRCYHPTLVDPVNNLWDSIWYQVNCFLPESLYLTNFIQDHMVLYVSGQLKVNNYVARDGSSREGLTIVATKINLDLLQAGVTGIAYNYLAAPRAVTANQAAPNVATNGQYYQAPQSHMQQPQGQFYQAPQGQMPQLQPVEPIVLPRNYQGPLPYGVHIVYADPVPEQSTSTPAPAASASVATPAPAPAPKGAALPSESASAPVSVPAQSPASEVEAKPVTQERKPKKKASKANAAVNQEQDPLKTQVLPGSETDEEEICF